jgi:hypothetical protein
MVCSSGKYGWSALVERMDGLLQSSVRMVCSNGEFGWSTPVEFMDGLLVWMVCSNREYGWSAPMESKMVCSNKESMDGLLQ